MSLQGTIQTRRGSASRRALLALLVIGIVVLVDFAVFGMEIQQLAWHLKHGNHVEMNGLRFRVPLLYAEDHEGRMNELSITRWPGRFSKKMAFIMINFHKQVPAGSDTPEEERVLRRLGVRKSSSYKVRLADLEGTCTDYVPLSSEDTPEAQKLTAVYRIRCTFGENLGANFSGSQNAVADFYAILQSGEMIKGKP